MKYIVLGDSPPWPAIEIAGTWNGWLVPVVSTETREEIAAWVEKGAERGDDDVENAAPVIPILGCPTHLQSDRTKKLGY